MNNCIMVRLCFLLLFSLPFVIGCGKGSHAPVSGIVTVNGTPTANVRVVFAPMATKDSTDSGPPSVGVTDETGRYELETRDGSSGAVVGTHKVRFNYADLEHMVALKAWRGSATSKEDEAKAQAKIDYVESEIKKRGAISKKSVTTIMVPDGGLDNADFEIGTEK